MNSEPLITIVIPIYNVEQYLDQCLQSLINQTKPIFKAVLVNDGSTDHSGTIAQNYVKKYPAQFSYFEQENKGLGAARNEGLKHVCTPFVAFLDSDDWWLPRSIENIEKAISQELVYPDLVFTCPVVYDMSTKQFCEWRDNERVKEIFAHYGRVLSPRIITSLYGTEASVCRLIVKTDLLKTHNFSFPEGIKWEDVFPHFAILNWAQRCILVENAGFAYRVNSGSQITSISNRKRLDIVPVFSQVFSYAFDNGWTNAELAYIFQMLIDFISWFLKSTDMETYPDLITELHSFARALPDECFSSYCDIIKPENKSKLLWLMLKSESFHYLFYNNDQYESLKRIYFKMKGWRH